MNKIAASIGLIGILGAPIASDAGQVIVTRTIVDDCGRVVSHKERIHPSHPVLRATGIAIAATAKGVAKVLTPYCGPRLYVAPAPCNGCAPRYVMPGQYMPGPEVPAPGYAPQGVPTPAPRIVPEPPAPGVPRPATNQGPYF